MFNDFRYALRQLRKNPGFTAAALLTLALSIGANTAVFSVVDSILLRPLPYADPDRLVMLFNSRPRLGIGRGNASMADYLDWKRGSRSFQSLDAVENNAFTKGRFTWTGDGGEPEQIVGLKVTATFFETLGVRPIVGRSFAVGDDQPGQPLTVVVSE